MTKLTGWEPTRRTGSRIHEVFAVPAHVADADEFFSYTTFDRAGVQLTTRQKLLDRFYLWNNTDDGMKPWVVMKLDPQEGAVRHIWWWGHYKEYHAICEHSYHGPNKVHRVRLFYRQESNRVLWLASAQLGPCYFYSEQRIRDAYLEILQSKRWYMAQAEREKVVAM